MNAELHVPLALTTADTRLLIQQNLQVCGFRNVSIHIQQLVQQLQETLVPDSYINARSCTTISTSTRLIGYEHAIRSRRTRAVQSQCATVEYKRLVNRTLI